MQGDRERTQGTRRNTILMWSTEENPKKETGKEKPESGKREASCQGNQRDRASQSREVGIANKAEE